MPAPHQSLAQFGAGDCVRRALGNAGVSLEDVRYAGIYDSFTITLAILLEETGLAPRGRSGALARDGHFSPGGYLPLNTHGGLLSYGHCGVGGAMAHLVEAYLQMTGTRRAKAGRTRRHSPCCMATEASCLPMSASSWSATDERGLAWDF